MTLLRRAHCCLLACVLALVAAEPAKAFGAPEPASDVADILVAAERAWQAGDYARVRELLEPLAKNPPENPSERQQLLVLLADASISDAALGAGERRERAAAYLERIMEAEPAWRMPEGIYTPELYDLYLEVRESRAIRAGEQCRANLNACRADLSTSQADMRRLELEKQALAKQLRAAREEQIVVERVKRVRALAAIPFGFGHFYNDQPAIGGSFLAAELAFGAAGLGLLINRNVLCDRSTGFQRSSLQCIHRPGLTRDRLVRLRLAEEYMGWFFIGTIALDIIVAQILFRPFETVSVQRAKETDIEEQGRPKRRPAKKARAKVRPTSAIFQGGGGLGLRIDF